MKLSYNREVIFNIVEKKPNSGKTAVMKMAFILQQVFNMNLGYKFDIHTYGPYDTEVLDDLDALIHGRFIDAETYEYLGSSAYALCISKNHKEFESTISSDDEHKISKVIELFGKKSAKELELDTTIIYMRNRHIKNKWGEVKNDIIKDVHEIKPHFSPAVIKSAYDNLEKNYCLN